MQDDIDGPTQDDIEQTDGSRERFHVNSRFRAYSDFEENNIDSIKYCRKESKSISQGMRC